MSKTIMQETEKHLVMPPKLDMPPELEKRVLAFVQKRFEGNVEKFLVETIKFRFSPDKYQIGDWVERLTLESDVKKAKLEAVIAYAAYLRDAIEEKKIKSLDELLNVAGEDWMSAASELGPVLKEDMESEFFVFGLMQNHELLKKKSES